MGAGSLLATDAQLASLHRSLDPITDRLAQNPDFADALGKMRELGVGTVEPFPAACEAKELPEAASAYYVTPDGDQSVLDGLWRLEIDEQNLLDAGLTPHDAYVNAGVWEFRITDGYADGIQPDGRPCNGDFAFDGERSASTWASAEWRTATGSRGGRTASRATGSTSTGRRRRSTTCSWTRRCSRPAW